MSVIPKDRQWRQVIEGLGIGLIESGVHSVPASKQRLESAFLHAWGAWRNASTYPSIRGNVSCGNEFLSAVYRSAGRQGATVTWTPRSGMLDLAIIGPLTTSEAAESIGDFPLSEWTALAKLFMSA